VFDDEDIEHNSVEQTGSFIMLYKDGASANFRKESLGNALVAITADRPDYNEYTGGAWTRTEVANTKFTLTHLFVTNSITPSKNILVMGENQYNSKSDAQDGAMVELTSLSTGALPTPEFIPIATFIIQCRDSYTNSYNARVVSTADGNDYIDFRTSEKTGVGAVATHHGNLSGLAEDDHLQYLPIDGSRAYTGEDIAGEVKNTSITISNPNSVYTLDTQIPIMEVKSAMTITKIVVSLNTSANQVAGDLKYADDLITFANPVVINDFDTTSGIRTDDSITSGTVAAGKWLYLQFDSLPDTSITFMNINIYWDYDL